MFESKHMQKNAPSHLYHTQVAEDDLKFKLGRDFEGKLIFSIYCLCAPCSLFQTIRYHVLSKDNSIFSCPVLQFLYWRCSYLQIIKPERSCQFLKVWSTVIFIQPLQVLRGNKYRTPIRRECLPPSFIMHVKVIYEYFEYEREAII